MELQPELINGIIKGGIYWKGHPLFLQIVSGLKGQKSKMHCYGQYIHLFGCIILLVKKKKKHFLANFHVRTCSLAKNESQYKLDIYSIRFKIKNSINSNNSFRLILLRHWELDTKTQIPLKI